MILLILVLSFSTSGFKEAECGKGRDVKKRKVKRKEGRGKVKMGGGECLITWQPVD